MEYKEVTVKIPKPLYDAIMEYLNTHPYYKDLDEFLLEAIREYNLERLTLEEEMRKQRLNFFRLTFFFFYFNKSSKGV
jgi:hypothetical protein